MQQSMERAKKKKKYRRRINQQLALTSNFNFMFEQYFYIKKHFKVCSLLLLAVIIIHLQKKPCNKKIIIQEWVWK